MVAACLLALIAYIFYDPQVSGTEGLLSFLFNRIHTEHIRIIINLGAILISSLLLLWINNIYTIVRAHSSLPLLFFLLLECSNPELTSELRIGNILVPVILELLMTTDLFWYLLAGALLNQKLFCSRLL